MASILKVDEMQGVTSAGDITITSEGGSATQSLQQGVAKAWSNVSTSQVINDSLNTSSLTDTATGNFDLNWTNNFSNTNYSSTGADGFYGNFNTEPHTLSTNEANVYMYNNNMGGF